MPTTAEVIRRKVEKGPEDRLWAFSDFSAFPAPAVAKTLSRLVDEGVVARVRKGVYYRPKTTRFGTTKPDPTRVFTHALDRKGIEWKPSGLSVWNSLGLTTQVPAISTFAVDRRVDVADPSGRNRLRRVASIHSVSIEERAALDALRDLRLVPDTTPVVAIRRLIDLCREGRLSFSHMRRVALHEPPRVRALLGLIGTELGEDVTALAKLRSSLNPTTTFKLGLASSFASATSWGIR
jgi:hypothetical protein